MRALFLTGLTALLAACGDRDDPPAPGADWLAEPLAAVRTSELVAGPPDTLPEMENPYRNRSDALVQGRQFYQAFNCGGCHGGSGGGGIGPPLADADWIYGGSVANIYASIVQGRPNGMPAFGPGLVGEPAWKLAAYVQTLSERAGEGQEGQGRDREGQGRGATR